MATLFFYYWPCPFQGRENNLSQYFQERKLIRMLYIRRIFMARKRYSAEQIIGYLREAEILGLSNPSKVCMIDDNYITDFWGY
jgi:hypothetical protein